MSAALAEIVVLAGTRPEVIKAASLVEAGASLWAVRQHSDLLDQQLVDLDLPFWNMVSIEPSADLSAKGAALLQTLGQQFEQRRPSIVAVIGDTATAFFGALAAHHAGIPVAHIEAGLRSDDRRSPWPEESYRRCISQLADWHFAPTAEAEGRLRQERVLGEIHNVGNTVIDALKLYAPKPSIADDPFVLVTLHRRETLGGEQRRILAAVRDAAAKHGLKIVFTAHPRPEVQAAAQEILGGADRCEVLGSVGYRSFLALLTSCSVVVTDSGGVQEEAPSLGKPVIVARSVTERRLSVEAGYSMVVGSDPARISAAFEWALSADLAPRDLYGDGRAGSRIAFVLLEALQTPS